MAWILSDGSRRNESGLHEAENGSKVTSERVALPKRSAAGASPSKEVEKPITINIWENFKR